MMIEFDEYKVKLNGLKPKLDELAASLGIERCKEDIERLHAQIESPGFWDNAEVSQKVMKQARQVEAKVERYEKMCSHWEDLMTICEMAIEENDDSMLDTLRESRAKNLVFVGNNVRARALSEALPDKNVLFAFALSAGHREQDKVCSIDLKKITIGQIPGASANEPLIRQIFGGTKYKVVYEPNMEDYLLCHAAFVMPAAFACYKTDGDLKKLKGNTDYLSRLIDANIEGYRAIRDAGHEILPKADAEFEGAAYRKTCLRFFKLMCATSLGKLCASDHAMNAVDEMDALNRDLKRFFDAQGAEYPVWQALERACGTYLSGP